MSISGFIGYYGINAKDVYIHRGLNKLLSSIENSIVIISDNYVIVTSRDYVVYNHDDKLKLISGVYSTEDAYNMCVKISVEDSLIIERDYWGVRTAYYYLLDDGVFFSSDVRFLIALPLPDVTRYDKNSIIECATLGYIYSSDHTLFCNIHQVYPGGSFFYNKKEYIVKKTTKKRNFNRFKDFCEALQCFTEIFDDVVCKATNSNCNDVLLLSGGMDSTSLALSATKNRSIALATFASSNNSDDLIYAKMIAKVVKSPHMVFDFDDIEAISNIPDFINAIENVEFAGVFDAFGGYAYYLLCKQLSKNGYKLVYPGEGADELLGGYYWPFTHSLGFVDRLKESTKGTFVYNCLTERFPLIEDKVVYRLHVFDLLQESALTNYHLSCVEHTAKAFNMINYPIYMTERLTDVIKDMKMDWLCDGQETKIILRHYLMPMLNKSYLQGFTKRKKLAMPSVVTKTFIEYLKGVSSIAYANIHEHPFGDCLGENKLNYLIFDVLHKYFTQRPLESGFTEEWMLDLEYMLNQHECIVHW